MKYTKAFLQIVCCTVAFSVTTTAIAQKKIEKTKLAVAPGQKLQIDRTLKSVTSLEMMGQQTDMNADVTATVLFEIKDKKENNYSVTSTTTKMLASASGMGQSMTYDSEKKDDTTSEMSKMMKDKINTPVEMLMNDEGLLTLEKKDTAAKEKQGIADMLGGMGADETAITDDVFILVPQKIKAGTEWSDSVIADGVKTYQTYTVKSLKGNEATLTLSGKKTLNKVMENMGMEMTMVMDSKLTGEIVVDIKTSVIKQKNVTAEGTGSMDVMGQSMPLSTKVEIISTTKSL